MIYLSSEVLRSLVSMPDAISAVRGGFQKVSAGAIEQPMRLALSGGSALAMLAKDRVTNNTVLKAVTIRDPQPTPGRAAVQALVILFDGPSGTPVAVIEGGSLTALRTGAASGVATDLLAAPEAHILGVIGSGGQSPDQIRAVCAVRSITEVRIASRNPEHSHKLAETMSGELNGIRFIPLNSNAEAIAGADVICTATSALKPLFGVEDLLATTHINAIGAFKPEMCELPPELFRDARVVAIDQVDAAMTEAGDLIQAIEAGCLDWKHVVELGELLAHPVTQSPGWTVFKSVGIAAQDLEVAELAVRKAFESGRELPEL